MAFVFSISGGGGASLKGVVWQVPAAGLVGAAGPVEAAWVVRSVTEEDRAV